MRLLRADNTTDAARKLYQPAPIPGYEKVAPLPWDAVYRVGFGRMVEADPMRHLNRVMLLHGSLISGRPSFDFTNPYAFMSRLYINKPTLVPNYGGGHESPQAIALNIAAGNTSLRKLSM